MISLARVFVVLRPLPCNIFLQSAPCTFPPQLSPAAFVQLRFYGFNMFTLILCICLVGVSVTYVVGAAGKTKGETAQRKAKQSKARPSSIGEVNNKKRNATPKDSSDIFI